MNVGSKCPIAWNDSWHAPWWQFYLHCGIEESGSHGIKCIVCCPVLHLPSEHGTSWIVKRMQAKASIAKLNKLTESEITKLTTSTVDETALAILKREGSGGITIVWLQRMMIFYPQFNPYWPKWQTKHSKLAAADIDSSEFHQDTWNRDLMLEFDSANIPWHGIANLERPWLCKVWCNDQLLPSTMTLEIICQREYALTFDAIKKQLLFWNKVSLALDRWTSTNKLPITSVIVYHMDRKMALYEVQLAFD